MRRALVFALAGFVTLLAFGLALLLGSAYFDARRYAAHQGRLQRLVQQQPRLEQVVAGLRDDGSPLVQSPQGEAELRALAARWPGPRGSEVLDKGRRWPVTRVFHASDMMYVLYFDQDGVLRDFTCADAR